MRLLTAVRRAAWPAAPAPTGGSLNSTPRSVQTEHTGGTSRRPGVTGGRVHGTLARVVRSGRRRRLPIVALVAVLLAALLWSLGSALADSSSPSPASGKKVVLQVGWYENLDSLNPFIGQQNVAYDLYRLNYDYLVNYDANTLAPIPGVATSWSHSARRQDLDLQDPPGHQVAGRSAAHRRDVAFTFNYIIKNQMTAYTNYTQFIKDAVALDPYHRALRLHAGPRPASCRCGCPSCRRTSGARSARPTRRTSSRTRRRWSAAAPFRWSTG